MVRKSRSLLRQSNRKSDDEEEEANQEYSGKESESITTLGNKTMQSEKRGFWPVVQNSCHRLTCMLEIDGRRKSLIESFHRRSSSMSVTTLSDVAKQALYKSRRPSVTDTQCLPLGLSNPWDARSQNHVFDTRKNKSYTPSISRVSLSSGRALWRFAVDSLKGTEEDKSAVNHGGKGGYSKPILTFRGGSAWKYLEEDREDLYLDLFWPTKKENPFRPDVMPLEGLAPLCNFRNLTFLKLTGMMRSYQKFIWQAVWLNPGLEVLELEMALEPCIRRTFNAGWPSIKGDWTYSTADDVCNNYQ